MGCCNSKNLNTKNQQKINAKFHNAILVNDIDKVKKYLSKGAQIDCKNDDGEPATHVALKRKYIQLLELLIKKYGADVNAVDSFDTNLILITCIKNKDLKILKFLIDCGANVNWARSNGLTPLHYCILKNYELACKYLLGAPRIDINAKENIFQRTSLHFACIKSNFKIVQWLCQLNTIDLNAIDCDGNTALHLACNNNRYNFKIVELLLIGCEEGGAGGGCDINLKNSTNQSALDLACKYQLLTIVKLLIEQQQLIRTFSNEITTKYLLANGIFFTES